MGVKVTPTKLHLQDEALPAIAAIAKELLLLQFSQGIDGNGVQHFHPNGKPWDFRNTGRLLDSLVATWQDGRVRLSFTVEYADDVNKKAPLSMSPETRQLFEERITPILQTHLVSK